MPGQRLPELAVLGTTATARPVHQLYERATIPDDPALTALDPASGTVLEWTAAKLNLIAAWAATPARTVRVAVIDSGADTLRPDLSSTVVRVHDAMATPQIAGIAALVRAANPALKARRVIRIIERSTGSARSSGLGWGIPDAAVAVRLAKAAR